MNEKNLQMGGGEKDYNLVMEAYRQGKITIYTNVLESL